MAAFALHTLPSRVLRVSHPVAHVKSKVIAYFVYIGMPRVPGLGSTSYLVLSISFEKSVSLIATQKVAFYSKSLLVALAPLLINNLLY